MSSDGAHAGVSAGRALRTILGGEAAPDDDERMDAATFTRWIETAPERPADDAIGEDGYTETARIAARMILAHLRAHPTDINLPPEARWEFPAGTPESGRKVERDLWDAVYESHPQIKLLDLTGFMAGWAMNAARRCVEAPPVANPAILTIVGKDGADGK